jgi:hypothetical protein
MRFRPANIRLINRRSKLLRLLLALSSGKESNDNDKNNPTDFAVLTRSLHIRPKRSLRFSKNGVMGNLADPVVGNTEAADKATL